jgi:hypothetical protein
VELATADSQSRRIDALREKAGVAKELSLVADNV